MRGNFQPILLNFYYYILFSIVFYFGKLRTLQRLYLWGHQFNHGNIICIEISTKYNQIRTIQHLRIFYSFSVFSSREKTAQRSQWIRKKPSEKFAYEMVKLKSPKQKKLWVLYYTIDYKNDTPTQRIEYKFI